jgi:hypothetical protein
MNAWPSRLSFVVWSVLVGVVIDISGMASPIVVRVPWAVVWGVLMLIIGLGVDVALRAIADVDRQIAEARAELDARDARPLHAGTIVADTERFPEIYAPDITYTPAYVGGTVRLVVPDERR